MTASKIREVLASVGKDKVACIFFDNGRTFRRDPNKTFDQEVTIVDSLEVIKIDYEQINGVVFTQVESTESVLAFAVMQKPEDIVNFDRTV